MVISRLILLIAVAMVLSTSGRAVADDKAAPKRALSINELNEALQKRYGAGLDREVELPLDRWFDQLEAKGGGNAVRSKRIPAARGGSSRPGVKNG